MNEHERRERLAQAHHNILNLDRSDIELDLLTDAQIGFSAAQAASIALAVEAPPKEADVEEIAQRVYGPARYVVTTKGRAAERALAAALDRSSEKLVTSGLFRTTEQAFLKQGWTVELGPTRANGSSDLDLDWLDQTMRRGGVGIVALEPCNNLLGGWPLSLEHLTEVRALCDRSGARLVLDATRLLANGSSLEDGRRLLQLADAFTVSCAKEALTPIGALVAVRDQTIAGRIFEQAFDHGTAIEVPELRAPLFYGLERVAREGSRLVEDRSRQLRLLADHLRSAGVRFVEPIGGHAVYVRVDDDALETDPLRARALEAFLYELAGVRARVVRSAVFKQYLMRLTWPLDRYADEQIVRAAEGVAELVRRAREAPALRSKPSDVLLSYLAHFERVSGNR